MKTESLPTQKSLTQYNFTDDAEIVNAIHVAADLKIVSSDGVVSGFTSFLQPKHPCPFLPNLDIQFITFYHNHTQNYNSQTHAYFIDS
jgi:hypothetical protein